MQECASQSEAPAQSLMNMPSNRATPMHLCFPCRRICFLRRRCVGTHADDCRVDGRALNPEPWNKPMTTDPTVSRLLALTGHEIEMIVCALSAVLRAAVPRRSL